MVKKSKSPAKLMAFFAALLFGASAPLSKLLLNDVQPMPLASLLYFGCGLGVLVFKCGKKILGKNEAEARITKKDVPWLAGMILSGGVAAPIILMFSLKATPAATASLLLNFEVVATALIAGIIFKESLGKRIWASIVLITIAAMILTWSSSGQWGFSLGVVGIIAACVLWGIDNNLTRNVSLKDPLIITIVKGIGAGTVSLILSFVTASSFPSLIPLLLALIIGAFSYGISIVLFIMAMRQLGAARTSAFFGTAPFIGSIISIVFFGEIPAIQFYISLPLMIAGAALILGERHIHMHIHEPIEHDHKHRHDDLHHSHMHEDGFSGEHTHLHVHESIEHEHPHLPEIHHRHRHK
jgi:drug/metabolite transporter (DMT)-like permease